jgi:predicted DNA-binding transcriptional regulator AlpA
VTNDKDDQTQPALWGPPDSERFATPGRRVARARNRSVPPEPGGEVGELWSIDQVADYLGVPKQTIYGWRTTGYGPRGFRVGKHLRWRTATVLAWTVDCERDQ